MRMTLALVVMLAASTASAQYRNYESGPNGTGGVTGTYGNENFDIDSSGTSGHIGGRRPGVIEERQSRTPGNIGATQRRCYADGNGNAVCQ